jgi:hypothetical protein
MVGSHATPTKASPRAIRQDKPAQRRYPAARVGGEEGAMYGSWRRRRFGGRRGIGIVLILAVIAAIVKIAVVELAR